MREEYAPILIDPRVGSRDLAHHFLKLDHPFELSPLEFGDCAFSGYGPTGMTMIGVERKNIRDLVQSLMSQRLSGHQLPGMIRAYDFRWLVIEGAWRPGTGGLVEVPSGDSWREIQPRIEAESLVSWLISLQLFGGVGLWQTINAYETARTMRAIHRWFQKPWEEHKSHLAVYHRTDLSLFVKPSLLRRWATELPGVGVERSKAVEAAFATPLALALADAKMLSTIKGIGPTTAKNIVKAITEPG